MKLAGDVCKILDNEYFNLKVAINGARFHRQLITSEMQSTNFLHNCERNKGSVVSINGTKLKITFPWKDLVEHTDNIMFFGTPFAMSRLFNRKFKSKARVDHSSQSIVNSKMKCGGQME